MTAEWAPSFAPPPPPHTVDWGVERRCRRWRSALRRCRRSERRRAGALRPEAHLRQQQLQPRTHGPIRSGRPVLPPIHIYICVYILLSGWVGGGDRTVCALSSDTDPFLCPACWGQAGAGTHADQGRRGSEGEAGGAARQVAHAAHTALRSRCATTAATATATAAA
eukprot:COSAG02_NODE_101_length_36804_cov_125.342951_18_plen_166_part_00